MGYYEREESGTPPAADYAAFYTYSDNKLLPLRTVTLQPFLIETVAQEASQVLPYSEHFSIPQRLVGALLKDQGFRLPSSDEWE